jgi:hypothetical protein
LPDLWGGKKETDRVQQSLDAFRKGIERVCKPVGNVRGDGT